MSRVVVLGAAGFIGSHLCDALLARGHSVVGIDDGSTSNFSNLKQLQEYSSFEFINADICDGISVDGEIEAILNFASPASPPRYSHLPVHTLRTGSRGTENALRLAYERGARLIMASTSEVYGDPTVSPQVETYWGHVNPIGERSCYDEAKRFAEALCVAYHQEFGVDVGIVRIFNTYGPRLDPNDGRVVSNFICQALAGQNLTVYGEGTQTRSFCYIEDLIKGILAMLDSKELGPINLGNPFEFTIRELADLVVRITGSESAVSFHPLPSDDPSQRCPDITLAKEKLKWEPTVPLSDGLIRTIDWFRQQI